MENSGGKYLCQYLGGFISESKKLGIERALDNRTRFITVVLEDIFQPHNASAVIRSCDCFGIQDLHVIENRNEFNLNPNVTQGSSKWIDIFRYGGSHGSNTDQCLDKLEAEGYHLYATSPHGTDLEIRDVELSHKIALMFGTEMNGLSDRALQRAHGIVKIPMYGFTESFNLSVSVALCLQIAVNKLHISKVDWHLSRLEKEAVRLGWYRKSVKNAKILERSFLQEKEIG